MPARERMAFKAAHAAFRAAVDPKDEWTTAKLASVVVSAVEAGWSHRTIAESLGIDRERTLRIARYTGARRIKVAPYAEGKPFPTHAVAAFRKAEDEVNLRRILTERTFCAMVRAAGSAGWSSPRLGALVGLSGARIRQIAAMDLSTEGVAVPVFSPAPKDRPAKAKPAAARGKLTVEEAARLRELADAARKSRQLGMATPKEESLKARRASEELSALIIAAKARKISWPDLDTACGYAPGGARTRAVRHGYGKTWPSLTPYTPTDPEVFAHAGLAPALSAAPEGA